MTSQDSAATVVKSVQVPLPAGQAFDLFTTGMGRWWPLDTHSIAVDTHGGRVAATGVTFEERKGGRIYETMDDSTEGDWGRILEWDPPRRVAFTWKPNQSDSPETRIEVAFDPRGNGTHVELRHSGWEQFGGSDANPRAGYDAGWDGVLGFFAASAVADRHR